MKVSAKKGRSMTGASQDGGVGGLLFYWDGAVYIVVSKYFIHVLFFCNGFT